jgi:NAD-dependent histone deacetylase SIR2
LPKRFYDCLDDIEDIDLIIIMGTSLKVYPFAAIPESANEKAKKVVFNMEKVGYYQYDKITNSSLFIKGKTDENILKFLKDVKLYDEFEKFIKEEYGQELKDIIGDEKKLMNVKDLEEKDKLNKIGEEISKMKLSDEDDMK